MILSVCTGAQLLAATGPLKNLKAATYWSTYDWLREIEPTVDVQEGAHWADNGRIVCSSGVSAGIDMTLHMIERLHGEETATRAPWSTSTGRSARSIRPFKPVNFDSQRMLGAIRTGGAFLVDRCTWAPALGSGPGHASLGIKIAMR